MAGVGAESISALYLWRIWYGQGGYGIRPYGGDFNDSVNMVWHNDKFMLPAKFVFQKAVQYLVLPFLCIQLLYAV